MPIGQSVRFFIFTEHSVIASRQEEGRFCKWMWKRIILLTLRVKKMLHAAVREDDEREAA
jgi:hypothetical protein